jgi:MFS family permease
MIYLTEMAPTHKRAFYSCMSNNGSNFGIFCSTLVLALVSNGMSEAAFYDYGWRIPFLIGGSIGLLGLWFRRNIKETPVFKNLQATKN